MEWPAVPLVNSSRRFESCFDPSFTSRGVWKISKNHIQTITNAVVVLTSRVTNIEQIVIFFKKKMASFAKLEQNSRLCKVEKDMVSDSNASGLGTSLVQMTAPQPLGPMAQGHLMTTETHDEGLILPQALKMHNHEVSSKTCEQYLKGVTQWIDTFRAEFALLACNNPLGIHCKAGSVSDLF